MFNLILRTVTSPYNDTTKGSVLSHQELDDNQINLKGEIIYTATTNNGLVSLKKLNGDSVDFLTPNAGVTGGTYNQSTGVLTLVDSSGTTININGFFTQSDDVYVSGLTFNLGTYDLTVNRNDGTNFTQSLSILASDLRVTGGTYNPANGVGTFTNNSGGTFNVTGFLTGYTDTNITGFTSNGVDTFTITDSVGSAYTSTITNMWTSGSTGIKSIKAYNSTGLDATGNYAVAEGNNTKASGNFSHAEGSGTTASGTSSHAEGYATIALPFGSHAEGYKTTASFGTAAHAEGYDTLASNLGAHAEGQNTIASGNSSHAEGISTTAGGNNSHAEGAGTIASGVSSHAEGNNTVASGNYSHAEGYDSLAIGEGSHAEGGYSNLAPNEIFGVSGGTAIGHGSHAEGAGTTASGRTSHAEGAGTIALGIASHAEGLDTLAIGDYSHAEGSVTTASGLTSHAEGAGTTAIGESSHAEGIETSASGLASHAEGNQTTASGNYSHAEGYQTTASGDSSHAEGSFTTSSGESSHAEGNSSEAIGNNSHSEGASTKAISSSSHAEGNGSIAGYKGFSVLYIINGVITIDSSYGDITSEFNSGTVYIDTNSDNYNIINNFTNGLYDYTTVTFSSNTNTEIIINNSDFFITSEVYTIYVADIDNLNSSFADNILGNYSHAEGLSTLALGENSHSEGYETFVRSNASHGEGYRTSAIGFASHAEGSDSIASGSGSHAEGGDTLSIGDYSHTEGGNTITFGQSSHAEGSYSITGWRGFETTDDVVNGLIVITGFGDITSQFSTSEVIFGDNGSNVNIYSVSGVTYSASVDSVLIQLYDTSLNINNATYYISPDYGTFITSNPKSKVVPLAGTSSHAEGRASFALSDYSHAEGYETRATGIASHSEGQQTRAIGPYSHAEGLETKASGHSSHAEGWLTTASGDHSHSEGNQTIAIGGYSHSEGGLTTAIGDYSHSEGRQTIASGDYSHAEGRQTIASGTSSHAEGRGTTASNQCSHAEGSETIASGDSAHAEGSGTIAVGNQSHAEGNGTTAIGNFSHAGGINTIASGTTSFVHGSGSTAGSTNTIVLGANITGTTANTTYVDRFNIKNLTTGTSINNIGIDVNGNVVTGTTSYDIFRYLGNSAIVTGTTGAIYRGDSISVTGNTAYFGTAPKTGATFGASFGHIGNGTAVIPYMSMFSNNLNGTTGPNVIIGSFSGSSTSQAQLNFSATKDAGYNGFGATSALLFSFRDSYFNPVAKFNIGTDYIEFLSYTTSRIDTGTTSNYLATNSSGRLVSKPISGLTSGTTFTGNIGINTTTPLEALDVNGAIKVGSTYTSLTSGATSPVPSGGEGTIVYDSVNKNFFGWTGNITGWKPLTI